MGVGIHAEGTRLFNKSFNKIQEVIGVRVEPELEHQLDQLALSMGKSRSACVREAIAHYVQRFSNNDEAQRQSALIAEHSGTLNWSEQLPDRPDWTV
ncbi:ribbon-helix-helix protein, CopG family [Cyanobium sp. Alchichica 3B3-8F6]|uniref:ribbon-helix-helix protein, CopG family n=1 Tax=Cyanobium sp. Alchichica 3B3-8F6 TaxID=2823696 RepID=UPI0020CD1981|nr:ribbon-helix-helix protein, CopG family [Cyanobium sp. Alchichica 3B3-8F6]MCP9883111.1 ribbon-helix-helix protein, CopG family [Cyanobium sp. Alchichica 3B3-8F6]